MIICTKDEKPEHLLVFTEGLADQHGLELTLRVCGTPIRQPDLPQKLIFDLLFCAEILDDGSEFDVGHRIPLGGRTPFPWTEPHQGDSKAILQLDPVLQHPSIKILAFCCQGPELSMETDTLPGQEVAEMLVAFMPDLIANLDAPLYPDDPALGPALAELAENSPRRLVSQGLTFELRLRQQGRCLDLVVAPFCLASVLHPIETVFGTHASKVLPGSILTFINEHQSGMLAVRHHDENGQAVQEGEGRFRVMAIEYAKQDRDGDMQEVKLPPTEALSFATIPEAELYEKHGMIRHLFIELVAPRSLLARMLSDVKEKVGDHDFDRNPGLFWDYIDHFTATPGNYTWQNMGLPGGDLGAQQFRLATLSGAYFLENEVTIGDSGELVRAG